MKIYTKTGDRGDTSLVGGARVRKDHPRIAAYGTVDELNSHIGVVRAAWSRGPIDEVLAVVQRDLFEIGAQLASDGARFSGVGPDRIADLEREIDRMEEQLTQLTTFILPGGSLAAAHLHVARTVCRRAERLVIALANEESHSTVAYLNRLSDYLFVAARFANLKAGVTDVPWTAKG